MILEEKYFGKNQLKGDMQASFFSWRTQIIRTTMITHLKSFDIFIFPNGKQKRAGAEHLSWIGFYSSALQNIKNGSYILGS